VKLVSQPDVPDTAKLSWLVLGRGPETATGGDLALLSTAASALLSKGESATLQGKIEEATGLDEFGFRTGSTVASSVVTLGKRLSSNAYLVYEQGLAAAASIVKLRYTLTPRLTVQTQAGTETAVDLFYNFYFD
jgi:translocation and assembly module TamB